MALIALLEFEFNFHRSEFQTKIKKIPLTGQISYGSEDFLGWEAKVASS